MHTTPVLQYLKKHGQLLDLEIAAATGIPLEQVHISISELTAQGEISRCSVTRFKNGKPIEGPGPDRGARGEGEFFYVALCRSSNPVDT